jgi:hypothetical protein
MTPSFHVHVSEQGNIFMAEIAALIAAALGDLGFDVVFPAIGLPARQRGRIDLVVAPHEYFTLQPGVPEDELLRAAECSVTVGVEQPGTLWFDLGARYSSVAPMVLDINPLAVLELNRRNIPARHLQLGYHHSWDRWFGESRDRPRDLLFLGSVAPRRERLLATIAPYLWDLETDIRLFEFPRPMTVPRDRFVAGDAKWELLSSSRALLNIHRSDVPYFEWVRVLEAVANGCLVITEPSIGYGPLQPGEHLIAAPTEYLGAYVTSILADEPLRAEIARSAYDLVRTKLEMTSLLEPFCEDMLTLANRPSGHRPSEEGRKRAPSPVVVEEISVPEPPTVLLDVLASEGRMKSRVKELIDSETALIRAVEGIQAQLRHGDPDHCEVKSSPGWDGFRPDTSVIVTTYNSEDFVARAIRSVLDSTGAALELIVVDDHSSDRSVEVVLDTVRAIPQFPLRVIARAANGGVSVARNRALEEARGRYVFVLDADNSVYPTGIGKLTAALDADSGASFAYGLIATVPDPAIFSHLPWDVARMCAANYIDAMAAIRTDVLREIGGYDARFGLIGWEDYELWLRFAAAGRHPAFVPSFIGQYYMRPGSRQETVNLDNPSLSAELRRKFAFLPWQ